MEGRRERGRNKGRNGGIIEEYGFQSCVIFLWSCETYSSLQIKRYGAFYVLRPQWVKELRFPAADCSVSSEELEQRLSVLLAHALSLFTVSPVLAVKLLCQLLEVNWDFAWFCGSCLNPLIRLQMISSALTVKWHTNKPVCHVGPHYCLLFPNE